MIKAAIDSESGSENGIKTSEANLVSKTRGGSGTAATSKMERFVIIVTASSR